MFDSRAVREQRVAAARERVFGTRGTMPGDRYFKKPLEGKEMVKWYFPSKFNFQNFRTNEYFEMQAERMSIKREEDPSITKIEEQLEQVQQNREKLRSLFEQMDEETFMTNPTLQDLYGLFRLEDADPALPVDVMAAVRQNGHVFREHPPRNWQLDMGLEGEETPAAAEESIGKKEASVASSGAQDQAAHASKIDQEASNNAASASNAVEESSADQIAAAQTAEGSGGEPAADSQVEDVPKLQEAVSAAESSMGEVAADGKGHDTPKLEDKTSAAPDGQDVAEKKEAAGQDGSSAALDGDGGSDMKGVAPEQLDKKEASPEDIAVKEVAAKALEEASAGQARKGDGAAVAAAAADEDLAASGQNDALSKASDASQEEGSQKDGASLTAASSQESPQSEGAASEESTSGAASDSLGSQKEEEGMSGAEKSTLAAKSFETETRKAAEEISSRDNGPPVGDGDGIGTANSEEKEELSDLELVLQRHYRQLHPKPEMRLLDTLEPEEQEEHVKKIDAAEQEYKAAMGKFVDGFLRIAQDDELLGQLLKLHAQWDAALRLHGALVEANPEEVEELSNVIKLPEGEITLIQALEKISRELSKHADGVENKKVKVVDRRYLERRHRFVDPMYRRRRLKWLEREKAGKHNAKEEEFNPYYLTHPDQLEEWPTNKGSVTIKWPSPHH